MCQSRETMKYVVVTGGVLSGLGKGISTSSIGVLLKSRGLKVSPVKIDPYLNVDAGTMNPYQHGEVFVLDDGAEVDLDLGNYERFLDVNLTGDHNITTGKAYRAVIEKERRGDYLGKTVQIIPHITDQIKEMIRAVGDREKADVVLIEVGGTVGDIEGMPFVEALRQLALEEGKENVLFVHTTLVPIMGAVGEQKTKPTQQSVRELRSMGVQPTVIIARGERSLESEIKQKIAFFCDVPVEGVISAPDATTNEEKRAPPPLGGVQGLLARGGWGAGGREGKIRAMEWARENDLPFKGVCLGFQLATVEFARHALGFDDANSTEFNPKTKHPVIDLLPEQRGVKSMGASMRLGAHPVDVDSNSKTAKLYAGEPVNERNRHRYEVSPDYLAKLEAAGLKYVGRSDDGRRMEILELRGHPYFVASQFHPELKSRPLRPSPLHLGLVKAAAEAN